jgi:putative acyl-CoA dehydrogenase
MPRLYREAPVNSIWEGSGNINALDVLRIVRKQPESLAALRAEIEPVASDTRIRAELSSLAREIGDMSGLEARARSVAERLALLWQASLLMQHAPQAVADAFVDSRLARGGRTMGTLPAGASTREIVERASPHEVPIPA